jgi:D-mannonate dehydratase
MAAPKRSCINFLKKSQLLIEFHFIWLSSVKSVEPREQILIENIRFATHIAHLLHARFSISTCGISCWCVALQPFCIPVNDQLEAH